MWKDKVGERNFQVIFSITGYNSKKKPNKFKLGRNILKGPEWSWRVAKIAKKLAIFRWWTNLSSQSLKNFNSGARSIFGLPLIIPTNWWSNLSWSFGNIVDDIPTSFQLTLSVNLVSAAISDLPPLHVEIFQKIRFPAKAFSRNVKNLNGSSLIFQLNCETNALFFFDEI